METIGRIDLHVQGFEIGAVQLKLVYIGLGLAPAAFNCLISLGDQRNRN